MQSRRFVEALDWYGRYENLIHLGGVVIPMGAGAGFLTDGALGALIGAGIFAGLLFCVYSVTWLFERVFPLPDIEAEPQPVQNEFAYGRSVDGRLSASWVSLKLTANNPGRWDERMTDLECGLIRKRWFGCRNTVYRLRPEKPVDWLLPAKGSRDEREFAFHKTFTDSGQAPKATIGEEFELSVIAQFGGKRRRQRVRSALPLFLVKGPYRPG